MRKRYPPGTVVCILDGHGHRPAVSYSPYSSSENHLILGARSARWRLHSTGPGECSTTACSRSSSSRAGKRFLHPSRAALGFISVPVGPGVIDSNLLAGTERPPSCGSSPLNRGTRSRRRSRMRCATCSSSSKRRSGSTPSSAASNARPRRPTL